MDKYKTLFLVYVTIGLSWFGVRFIQSSRAATLFVPDSDTALLLNLVTTTASQLNELEKLVTSTEKYTGLMEKYNQIARDEYFRAERISWIAQNYVDLSKKDPKDLEELNSAIKGLKSETASFHSLINEYRKDEAVNENLAQSLNQKVIKSNNELNFANSQVMRSGDVRSTNEAQKMIAQNSALSYKAQVESNQMNQLIAEKIAEQNKLKARELKEEAKKEAKREEFYQFKMRHLNKSKEMEL